MAPRLLTQELADKIITATMNGSSAEDSAGAVGTSRASLQRWLKHGRELIAARDSDELATPKPYLDDDLLVYFASQIDQARLQAKVEAELVVRQFMLGVDEEETTDTLEYQPESPHADDGGLVVVKRIRRRRKRRDLRAALEFLRARWPKEWAPVLRGEFSGPDGTPIPIEQRARSLADQAEQYLQAQDEAADDDEQRALPPAPQEQ